MVPVLYSSDLPAEIRRLILAKLGMPDKTWGQLTKEHIEYLQALADIELSGAGGGVAAAILLRLLRQFGAVTIRGGGPGGFEKEDSALALVESSDAVA